MRLVHTGQAASPPLTSHASMTDAPGHAGARDIDRTSNRAALTMALTLPGDVVLYLLLPIYAAEFGVSLPEAGLLLASNRLVRIVGYGWVARFYERHGPGPACTLAAIATAAATLSYALVSGVALLMIGRLAWGLAFAALNIATQALATAEPVGAARRNGVARSIIACGPMLALLAGAALALWVGPRPVFALLALVALLAIPLARRLPAGPVGTVLLRQPRLRLPSQLERWVFVQGLTLDGLFMIGLTVLAVGAMGEYAALGAGAAMALRYAGEITLGPAAGRAAGHWGAARLLVLLSWLAGAALAAIGFGWLWSGAIALTILRSLLQPLPAPVAAARHPGAERIGALARLATWRDIGAGLGPLAAGWLLGVMPTWSLYGIAGLLVVLVSIGLDRGFPPHNPRK